MITSEQLNDLTIDAYNELRRLESELILVHNSIQILHEVDTTELIDKFYEHRFDKIIEDIELQIQIIKDLEEEEQY